MKDRHERKHRRTARHPECVRMMAEANFDAVPPLPDVLVRNFVVEVNGHQIYRHEDGVRCCIWTPHVGWWGFDLDEAEARRVCATVNAPSQAAQERSS